MKSYLLAQVFLYRDCSDLAGKEICQGIRNCHVTINCQEPNPFNPVKAVLVFSSCNIQFHIPSTLYPHLLHFPPVMLFDAILKPCLTTTVELHEGHLVSDISLPGALPV
jgi:hypothetical protein